MSRKNYLTFGIIADVQYANIDDGTNFARTRTRHYRAALQSLQKSVAAWKVSHSDLAFVLQLGDLIDGVNIRTCGKAAATAALKTALEPFKTLSCPTYHVIGNHDLYNLTRVECRTSELNCSNLVSVEGVPDALYYSVLVHPSLKLIMLDSYDVGVLGFKDCPQHPHFIQGENILEQNNPNKEKNSAVGLEGVAKRFVAYNGGIGKQQLRWVDAQLRDADALQQNVLICGHVQLHPAIHGNADAGTCLAWNYEDIQEVIHSRRCVIGYLMGHDHDGSFSMDPAGIPQLVMNGVIETPPGTDAYATAFLTSTTLEIKGFGAVPSVTMPLVYTIDGFGVVAGEVTKMNGNAGETNCYTL